MDEKNIKDKLPENRFTTPFILSESEFKKEIIKAEKGPFDTVQESMKEFETWLEKRNEK